MLSQLNKRELSNKGYTVINNVITEDDCDKYRSQYENWLERFKDGEWPISFHSLIQRYRIGHMEPTWAVRLQSKSIFAQLWETNKLLSSFDAIAIGRPPESGKEKFANDRIHWLHCDQSAERVGLHVYQGAVYLEDAEVDDWTFEVLERSHELHQNFFETHHKAKMRSIVNGYYNLTDTEVEWYKSFAEVKRKRIPVPKGGMVLWDARLIHANARPIAGRRNHGRWRFVVFVCMAPASWASKIYIKAKQNAYCNLLMTSHWPCDGIECFFDVSDNRAVKKRSVCELPEIAKTVEAKQLAGVLPYEVSRSGSGQTELKFPKPEWIAGGKEWKNQHKDKRKIMLFICCLLLVCGFVHAWIN